MLCSVIGILGKILWRMVLYERRGLTSWDVVGFGFLPHKPQSNVYIATLKFTIASLFSSAFIQRGLFIPGSTTVSEFKAKILGRFLF